MAISTEDFVKQIETMSVLDLSNLVKALETRFGQRQGMGLKQRLAAVTAFAVVAEARCRDGVLGVARRTGDDQFLVRAHRLPPSTMKFCAVTMRLSSAESHRTMRAISGG